jgi:hypothetical protein
MSGPLSPEEIFKFKAQATPEFVYRAINELIAETVNSKGTASFFFRTASARIIDEMDKLDEFKNLDFGEKKRLVDDRGWLNVESAYRAKGWSVTTDRTDEGTGFFVFKPQENRDLRFG